MNSTATTTPVKANGIPKRHLFTLQATIDEATYNVFPVRQIDDPEIERAFTLRKLGLGNGDAVYTVARHADGRVMCECPDFVARHEDHGTLYKHGQCCVRMGLLDAPTQIATSVPRPMANLPQAAPTAPTLVANLPQASPEPEPVPAEGYTPACTPARQPELRRVAGMTIDLDVWRNGPRAAQEAPRAFGQGIEVMEGRRPSRRPRGRLSLAVPRPRPSRAGSASRE